MKKTSSKKRRSRIVNWIFRIIIVFALGVLIFCAVKLLPKLLEYKASDDAFNKLKNNAVTDLDQGDLLEDETEADEPVEEESAPDTSNALGIDWEAFKGTDIVAWFQMDSISYPVMQSEDNEFYLHHLPDGSYNYGGSLFLYSENDAMFTDQSSFIYGHNMNNGSMFGTLKNYTTDEYADHTFYLYLPDGTRHEYLFFSVALVGQTSQCYTWSFANEESFLNWQKWMKDSSMINCVASIDATKNYVTLSTCNGYAGTDHRLVVCGQEQRVDKLQEPASWYNDYAERREANRNENLDVANALEAELSEQQRALREDIYNVRHSVDSNE